MKIFMSHHASAKPLVREVRGYLPSHVNAWVDEHEILAGENISESLRSAIATDVDFLILWYDTRAAASRWVRAELEWALKEEARVRRPFVIPVVLDAEVVESEPWLRERLYLRCNGYSEAHVRSLADELSSALFAWLSRDLDALRAQPANSSERLLYADRADALLGEAARAIRRIVFPYRRDRPLPLRDLLARLNDETELGLTGLDELHELLYRLRDRKMISGLALTGKTIFIGEEHLNWRSQEAVEEKRAAAEYLIDEIAEGSRVYLDAGSSTLAVCRSICRGVRFRQWTKLTVATISVPIAAEFSDLANELGMEDEDPRLRVVVLGGQMRLNTSALVDDRDAGVVQPNLPEFDMAIVGSNGISAEFGCTTTARSEAAGKRRALLHAERRVVLAEPSKYGVWQAECFANFDDGITIVTACGAPDGRVAEVVSAVEGTSSEVVVVPM